MRKLFFRYFAAILLVAFLIIAFQNGFLFLRYHTGRNAWQKDIYDVCVKELEKNLQNSSFPDLEVNGRDLFATITRDNRVSGYLVRDDSGSVVVRVGQTPDGRMLTSFLPQHIDLSDMPKFKVKRTLTILNVVPSDKIFRENVSFKIEKYKTTNGKNGLILPPEIKANDIIGSVSVAVDGSVLFTVDILVYSPRTYAYSKQIINSCLRAILITIPVCVLIAVAGAWYVSARNTSYISSVRASLKDLSDGKENVKLPLSKDSFLNDISIAIGDLDKNLQADRKRRNIWLNSISHDLNTPTAALKIIIDGLNDGIFKPNKENISQLQNEIDTLSARIDKVNYLATLMAGTTANIKTVKTDEFVQNISSYCTNVETLININEIDCDETLMTKACIELLKNAEEVSNSELVKLSVSKNNNIYTLIVENKGSLPADFTEMSLFEPWTRGDTSRTSGGSGLGLPIVGVIAELHGGKANIKQENDCVVASISWAVKQNV